MSESIDSIIAFLESKATNTTRTSEQLDAFIFELRGKINQLSVNVLGTTSNSLTLLYSGKMLDGTEASIKVKELVDDNPGKIRTINQTEVFKLLDSEQFERVLRASLGSENLATDRLYNDLIYGRKVNGIRISDTLWDDASFRFGAATEGSVRIIAPNAKLDHILAQTEFRALFEKSNFTDIDGVSRAQILELDISLGREDLKQYIFNHSYIQMEISDLANGHLDDYLSLKPDDYGELLKDPERFNRLDNAFGDLTPDRTAEMRSLMRSSRDIGNDLVSRGVLSKVANKLGPLGATVGFLLATNAASAAESAGHHDEAKQIMTEWAIDETGSLAGEAVGATIAGIAVAVATAAGVAVSAPVAGTLILGAALTGGFFGADSATNMYNRIKNLDEAGKRDFFDQVSFVLFGDYNISNLTVPEGLIVDGHRISLDTIFSQEEIVANAKTNIAWRYALKNLNTFIIEGEDSLYTPHNPNGELDLDNFTEEYLQDRAAMLSWRLQYDKSGKEYTEDWNTLTSGDRNFIDHSIQISDGLNNTPLTFRIDGLNPFTSGDHQIVFGSKNNESLVGDKLADRLYGGAGNDTLEGKEDNDYLEGGTGDDTLIGGKGLFDIVDGGIGHDTYIFNIGDQQMTIRDSDMNGKIIIRNGIDETILGRDSTIEQVATNIPIYKDDKDNRFELNGTRLYITTIDGEKIIVEGFTSGDLGIRLPTIAITTPITNQAILGDLIHQDFDSTTPGIQTQVDALGNIIQIPDQIEEKQDQLFGSNNADLIQSGALNDIVKSKNGDDIIEGGSGSDILVGGSGDDRLFADQEADFSSAFNSDNTLAGISRDWLAGGDGNDQLIGSAGSDVLSGGGGHDLLVGGAGDDYILGDSNKEAQNFNWTVTQTGNDYFFSSAITLLSSDPDGADTIYAGGGNDVVWAGGNNDNVFGGSGNDLLLGENGDDNLFGDAGNDTLYGGQGEDLLSGGIGNDKLFGGKDNDQLYGNKGKDELQGGEGNDSLFGGNGIDLLIGNKGNDTLFGENDADHLQGHEGSDTLYGGQGNDTLIGGSGNDTLMGGTGNDLLLGDYADDKAGILNQFAGNDILKGGQGNDKLYGFSGEDELSGGTGNDLLRGGKGNDQYFFAVGDGQDTIDDNEGNNELIFNSIQSTLSGSLFNTPDGSNYLALQYGNNDIVYIKDGMQGTINTYSINGTDTHYSELINLAFTEAIDYQMTSNSGALYASRFNDTLRGSHTADIIFAQDGDDIVIGGAGNDTLLGGTGSDWLQGGTGDDTLIVSDDANWSSHFIAFNAGSPGHRGTGERITITDMLRSHDLFDGGDGQDTIQGSASNDSLFLHDTYSPLPNGTGPRIKNIERFDMGAGDDIVDLTSPIHNLGDVILNGDSGNDVLWGSSGNDLLNGGQGDDKLSGGLGNDTYQFTRGDNHDIIREQDSSTNNHDVLSFLHDINHDQLWFTQDHDDLRINIIESVQNSVSGVI